MYMDILLPTYSYFEIAVIPLLFLLILTTEFGNMTVLFVTMMKSPTGL